MSDSQRYALIDRYSSLVVWVGEASSPELACTIANAEANPGQSPIGFERVESSSVDAGFNVYLAVVGEIDKLENPYLRTLAARSGGAFLGVYQAIAPRDLSFDD